MGGGGKVELQKSLGLFNCISLLIGLVIGTGIFISPKDVILASGSVGSSLIVWLACGLFSIFGAIAYTELGCMIPKAGGEYEYLGTAFGDLFAFLFVWAFLIIIVPTSFALTALTFADYVLQPFYVSCLPPYYARIFLAALSIITITLINCVSVKWVNRLQSAFNLGKFFGLFAIMGIGCYALFNGQVEHLQDPFIDSSSNPKNLGNYATAFQAGLYSFSGWSFLNYVVEEIKNPNKVLPVSIISGLGIVIFIYIFVNLSYFTLLSPKEMIESSAVAFTFVERIVGPYSWVMSICVVLSCLGFLNGSLFSASRTIFAAARKNHMPSVLALLNIKYNTPITSIVFMSVLSLLCLVFDDIQYLVQLTMLTEYIFIGSTVLGLIWLRHSRPDLERPMKVSLFFPIVFVLICFVVIGMKIWFDPRDAVFCISVIAAGIPVYSLFVLMKKPKSLDDKINNFTIWMQKMTVSIIDLKEE